MRAQAPRRALVLCAGALLVASAAAQAAPRRPALSQVLRGEALERYELARQDFKSQRYPQALTGFVRAYALSREPRLRWNAAACLRKLERNAEALRTLDAYLTEASGELAPEELEEARRSQDALRALVATALITLAPADARLSIDGAALEAGGSESVYLEPGPHAFLAEKPGYASQHREVTARAGERLEWRVSLAPIAPIAPVGALKPSPVAEPLAQPAPPASRPRWAPWLTAAGGAALAVSGGVLLGVAAADFAQLRGSCGTMCSPARWAASRDAELAGVVLLGVGGLVAAAGLGWGLWWTLDGAQARVALGPTQLSFEVRF